MDDLLNDLLDENLKDEPIEEQETTTSDDYFSGLLDDQLETESDFKSLIQNNIDADIFTESDFEGVDGVDADSYNKVLANSIERIKKEAQETVMNDVFAGMSDTMKFVYQQELNGGNAKDYLRIILDIQETVDLDTDNSKDQETIVREYYKSTGMKSEVIESKIKRLKSREDDLQEEAILVKDELIEVHRKKAQDKAENDIKAQNYKNERNKISADNLTKNLLGGITVKGSKDKINLTREEAKEIFSSIQMDYESDFGKGKVLQSNLEHCIDYHRYSPKGDTNRLIQAVMILDPSGKYDEKLRSLFKKEAVNKTMEELKASSDKKSEVTQKPTSKQDSNNNSAKTFKFK
jgi:hypothetical protein